MRDGASNDGAKVLSHEVQLRVHEREERQHAEVHEDGNVALHALERRGDVVHHALHAPGSLGEVVLPEHVVLVVIGVVEVASATAQPVAELGEAHVRAAGKRKGEDDAGERRVDARVEHAGPEQDPHRHVGAHRVDAGAVEPAEHSDKGEGGDAPCQVGRLAVEERDDHDGEDVVGDGERLEEHLGRRGDALAQERDHAEREGDVGCDGHRPAARRAALHKVHCQVDEGRRAHAPHRGEHGEGGLARTAQLPDRDLVLELYSHEQEEDGRQEVVHELLHGERDREPSHPDLERKPEEVLDDLVERGVRDHEREQCRAEHDRRGNGAAAGHCGERAAALQAPDDRRLLVDARTRHRLTPPARR